MATLPVIEDIRSRIDKVRHIRHKNALRYQYLICGRVSEVCGSYAPIGTDAMIVDFDGEEAVLFPVKTAKRKGKIRPIALPLKYEPWARALVGWFEHRGNEKAFPFTERALQRQAVKAFVGLSYPIEKYTLRGGEEVPAHWKPMCTHALRHIRALQDLMCFYGFDGLDLAIYGGWSSQTVEQRLPGIASRYLHLIGNDVNTHLLKSLASKYFPKLLKERNFKNSVNESYSLRKKCQKCGREDGLVVHHIDGNNKNNSKNNLRLLCRRCHSEAHGKGSLDSMKLLHYLSENPNQSPENLAKDMDCATQTMRNALVILLKLNLVERVKYGIYKISQGGVDIIHKERRV